MKVAPYTLPERVPHDEEFGISYSLIHYFTRGSDGIETTVGTPTSLSKIASLDLNRATDLNLQLPQTGIYNTTFENMSLKGKKKTKRLLS